LPATSTLPTLEETGIVMHIIEEGNQAVSYETAYIATACQSRDI